MKTNLFQVVVLNGETAHNVRVWLAVARRGGLDRLAADNLTEIISWQLAHDPATGRMI